MKWITGLFILLLIAAIVVVITLPKKERIYTPIQREAPAPQVKEEPMAAKVMPISEPTPMDTVNSEEKIDIKVNFYKVEPENGTKGEFLGFAELIKGKLIIDVSDPSLKEILEKPYSTMSGEIKEAAATDSLVTYQPGTIEHLETIAVECWQFGYLGEIE